jgi:thiamine-phosphate pyrophosphorylase
VQARTFYKLPIVAIGGITLENIPNLLDKDINAVALISSIFNAGNIEARTRKICNLLESNQHE